MCIPFYYYFEFLHRFHRWNSSSVACCNFTQLLLLECYPREIGCRPVVEDPSCKNLNLIEEAGKITLLTFVESLTRWILYRIWRGTENNRFSQLHRANPSRKKKLEFWSLCCKLLDLNFLKLLNPANSRFNWYSRSSSQIQAVDHLIYSPRINSIQLFLRFLHSRTESDLLYFTTFFLYTHYNDLQSLSPSFDLLRMSLLIKNFNLQFSDSCLNA